MTGQVLGADLLDSGQVGATLFYAGDISGRGRFDVPDPSKNNINFEPVQVAIHDARALAQGFDLDAAGFTFARHAYPADGMDALFEANLEHQIHSQGATAHYERDVAAFLKTLTGASEVIPQIGGTLARTSNRAKRKSWATPANFVHLDFTADSADKFLHWSLPLETLAAHANKRYAIYQTWRALSPGPQDNTLTICDGSSVPPEDAVIIDSVIGPEDQPGAFFETRICRYRDTHRWYYLSDMTPDDLLVFKGFDSSVPLAMNAMHTAFDNPLAGADAHPRRSIEARFFAFFD